ncbi:MAG: type II secretion system ATPase GspE [Deltaproteobacteria bacterium]|nr:type II secretion system ATPase GspE [Deltaproteobacteria bacterium]MBW2020774.1 type II secretion system ATPase GspE [Deltaproteobacteria bacterium]MBW2075376.1 type II secretion system ATPase GspE [Deltaproteobacteria bacterium]RLB80016.1 MAG: type II secretion system protein GspE [Deltaproteobacteria bacterium]
MKSIGEILKELCGLSEEAIADGLKVQEQKGGQIGEILSQQKTISESDLLKALSIQFDLPFLPSLPLEDLNTDFTEKVPIQFLKKYKMVPVFTSKEAAIAVHDPRLFQPLDDLRLIFGWKGVKTVLAPYSAILSAINFAYDMSQDSAEQVIQDMHEEDSELILSEIEQTGDLLDETSDAPIIKLVNLMLSQAIKSRASDIHIEPYQNRLKIRYRVDGLLYDVLTPPKHIQPTLVSRIKIMAKLNIAEKRLPQDGRIEIRIGDRNVDIRVSTIPTAFGERVVLRLLDKSNVLLKLSDLGLPEQRLKLVNKLIRTPHGIILVTGPTGSGKTTTLYAALTTINNPDINIITIEDPIEYQIEGIGQIQVNPKVGLNFANGLRSIVRQDPDVILVGEIRDLETAEIAIQSALTGHLVFSTLHTNDSASAVTRLIDMGIEPFLVSSSVIAILAQRLVRVICNHCKEPYTPDEDSLETIGITPDMFANKKLYRGKGCPLCLHTGYKGRTGIFELMILDDTIKTLILKTSDANTIKHEAVAQGMVTLRQDGAQKVMDGITTIEEVFRITQQ